MIQRLTLLALLGVACSTPQKPIQSVVLSGGSYVRIENRQVAGGGRDSTSLGFFSDDVFSIEIRAAGDSLPSGLTDIPALFMIGDDRGDSEIGIFRATLESDRILVTVGNQFVQNSQGQISLVVPGCDWNDPNVFTLIVVTYDGTTVNVYGNGESLASSALNFDVEVSSSDALIGANWGDFNDVSTLSNFWYGAIDEVRLWRAVLPPDEMDFRYKNPSKLTKRYSATGLDPLLALWRFNITATDSDIEPDRTTNGNDAILHAGSGTLTFSTDGP